MKTIAHWLCRSIKAAGTERYLGVDSIAAR